MFDFFVSGTRHDLRFACQFFQISWETSRQRLNLQVLFMGTKLPGYELHAQSMYCYTYVGRSMVELMSSIVLFVQPFSGFHKCYFRWAARWPNG